MKYNLKIIIFLITFISCSKKEDPIIGTWYAFKYNNEEVNTCKKKTNVTFKEDGTFLSITYDDANKQNECKIVDESKGTWLFIRDNIYTGKLDYQQEFDNVKIVFNKERNIMIIDEVAIYKKTTP